MSDHNAKASRRQLRKLVGSRAAETVVDVAYDFRRFRERGFWARFKWLLFGR